MEQKVCADAPLLSLLPLLYKQILNSSGHKEYGITKSQLFILLSLSLHGTLNMTQIAKYISSSKEQATRAVAGLVEDDFVERLHDEENRTKIYIRLTKRGERLLEKWRTDHIAQLHASLDERLTAEEQEKLREAAKTLTQLLSKLN